ncbi:MAG: type II 3-dehydroquinate dehydratase [Candidatus Coatesbacteria bacterium]|nr:type II 3-dehydroquinate dehydratase [Candidatus Coatesbacteria bacterium]
MKRIKVLNGPNLNLLGLREVNIYGDINLSSIKDNMTRISNSFGWELVFKESNHEGVIIDEIQDCMNGFSALIINAGGYTHSSVSIRDALAALKIPKIDVHISNIFGREEFREKNLISPVCNGTITGFGYLSYNIAMFALKEILVKEDENGNI